MRYEQTLEGCVRTVLDSYEGRIVLGHLMEQSGIDYSPGRDTQCLTDRAIGKQLLGRDIREWFMRDLSVYGKFVGEMKKLKEIDDASRSQSGSDVYGS